MYLVSLAAVLISYFLFGSFYKLGSTDVSIADKDLCIMTFNTRAFSYKGRAKSELTGNKIINFIRDQDPDIVCFQESNRRGIRRLREYPFFYITPYTWEKSTQAILSKYPIVSSGSLEFPNTGNNAIYADIKYEGDTIRIYNLHLQSYQIIPSRIKNIRRATRAYEKMIKTFELQEEQVEIFNKHRKESQFKTIVCADLNSTPFSNVYRIARGEMHDTFDEKGSGFGKTFDLKLVPFRIDFILADKTMEIMTHQNFDLPLSDHYPVMSSILL